MLAPALLALAILAAAIPTPRKLPSRAGGPTAKPIPSTCHITNVLPPLGSNQGALPADSTNDALFYAAYYPSPSKNKTALSEQCLQQCYGYGDSTECKAVFWAENVVTPRGNVDTACLFYNRTFTEEDFRTAPDGQGTTPFAVDLQC